ncbi:MAG: SGNH/GDSL hydrolase family protein [Candidatus Hodarchaeota archaeon]
MLTKIKILCIGDSHTAGYPFFDPMYGGNPESSYEYWVNLHLTNTFSSSTFILENHGICGQGSSEVYNRLKKLLTTNKYDIIIYWAGANDIAIGYSIQSIWKNLWKAYKLAKEKTLTFILVTIPPMDWYEIDPIIVELNEKILSNSKNNYHCADVYPALEEKGKLKKVYNVGDGVHLSVEGYRLVGKVISDTLSEYLKSRIF